MKYTTEYDRWLDEQAEYLRSRQLEKLDIENLIEELEELGNELRRKVESYAKRIIEHLLYCEYWLAEVERNKNHWQGEIAAFRDDLEALLTTNLRKHLEQNWDKIYDKARRIATLKSQIFLPIECPYTLKQILNQDFLP
jgi:hypothetical protein